MPQYSHDEVIHNFSAAEEVLPILFEKHQPASVLDVGCGLGNWAATAKKIGVSNVIGIDGEYVNRSLLKIQESEFVGIDLRKKFDLKKKFDLVICLEVAEHLPKESADTFIESLVNHSDVILFSAALPGQGGQFHINEQWPSYWQQIFERHKYQMIDFFRKKIWNNSKIDPWYRQNMFLVVKKGHALCENEDAEIQSYIHPELFTLLKQQHEIKINNLQETVVRLSNRDVLGKAYRSFKKRFLK